MTAKKGSAFEREFCKDLSLWWSLGEREDIFWRSSNSGGRATVRSYVGKTTAGQYGDVAAIDPIGNPFLELVTIELKRGYSIFTIQDVFDKKPKAAQQQWSTWYEQTVTSAKNAGSHSWLLITRRDQRDPLVYMPSIFYKQLCDVGCFNVEPVPCVNFTCDVRTNLDIDNSPSLAMMRWEDWKSGTNPQSLLELIEKIE